MYQDYLFRVYQFQREKHKINLYITVPFILKD